MQPFIAITVGEIVRNDATWSPVVHGQAHTYTDAVVHAGGVPIIIPLVDDETALRRLYDQCSGLLFSGGNDLDPASYNADPSPHIKNPSPKRDKQELKLLGWALNDDKPVLGICRGMQLINVALGGSLHQDIVSELPDSHNHEVSAHNQNMHHIAHELTIKPGSLLAKSLSSDHASTNALHHQAIQKLGDGIVATAHAEDGIIEAIELPGKKFVVGIQSHPEALEAEAEPLWRQLFVAFIDSAKTS